MCEICDKILSIEKYQKLRKCLFESNCSWKRALRFNKGVYLFHKRALG